MIRKITCLLIITFFVGFGTAFASDTGKAHSQQSAKEMEKSGNKTNQKSMLKNVDQMEDIDSPEGGPIKKTLAEYRGHEENLIPLNKLFGIGVFTESGEEVGEIENIIVDPRTGLAAFVVVNSELFGEDLKAVPTNIMTAGEYSESFVITDNKFAASLPSDYRATEHGTFTYENAKQIYSENEMRDNVGVLRKMKSKEGNGRKMETGQELIEASVLEGIRVVNENDAPIGNLDTMLVDLNTMMITLGLVRMTGPDLTAERIKAVPWPALKLDPANYRFEVAVADEKQFEKSPSYIQDEADFSIDAARSLYSQFGFKYYQTPVD